MKLPNITGVLILIGFFAGAAQADDVFCPSILTPDCVMAAMFAELNQFDDKQQENKYAITLAKTLVTTGQSTKAFDVFKQYGAEFSRFDLLFLAKGFATAGMAQEAQEIFRMAVAVGEQGKDGSTAPLDLLAVAQYQVEHGFAKDARMTLQKAAILAKAVTDSKSIIYRITKVAMLQRVSGWPEDVAQTLDGADVIALGLERPYTKAFGLAGIAREYALAGFPNKSKAVFARMEMAISSGGHSAKAQHQMVSALISSHASAGLFEDAERLAGKYNFSGFDDSLFSAMNILQSQAGDYISAPHPSTFARLEALAARIQNVENADTSYAWLIRHYAEAGDIETALEVLQKIKGSRGKSEAAYNIIEVVARENKDPVYAAQLLDTLQPSGEQLFPQLGNLAIRYPVSLIGSGFVDQGAYEKALPFLEQAFDLYLADPGARKTEPWGLYHDFAETGQRQPLYDRLELIADAEKHGRALQAVALGYAKSGHLVDAVLAAQKMEQAIEALSDAPIERLKMFYPEGEPVPSERSLAMENMQRVYVAISRAYAAKDDAANAIVYADKTGSSANAWRATMDLAKLYERLGNDAKYKEAMRALFILAQETKDIRSKAYIFKAIINAI